MRNFRKFDPTNMVNELKAKSQNQEVLRPAKVYKVTTTFESLNISQEIKQNIKAKGFTAPTPIQEKAIQPILDGRDLIGIANTGTGKTAAFLIPLINKVLKDRNQKILILAPTRELATQIKDELYVFAKRMNIYSALCIGGANMRRQKNDLMRNPNFVIATPGRLEDHIKTGNLRLSGFATVVLDEADHMVDIGFIQNVRRIVSLLPGIRQSICFSATIEGPIKETLKSFVRDPVVVSVISGKTAESVNQEIIKIKKENKVDELHKLLITEGFKKVLVFGRTKHGVQRLSDELSKRGFRSDTIHGNKKQNQRIRTLENFKRNNLQILVATDVAARGLDIPNVSHVINFDLPETQEAYIHRIGRTGRASEKGVAITFVEYI